MFSTLLNAISKNNDINDEKYKLLRDDDDYDDLSASRHQYDKDGVNYIASLTAKVFIEQFLTGNKWKELENGDTISGDARTYATIIIQHARKIKKNNYEMIISYKYSKTCKTGRRFDDGMGTQILNKAIRSYFLPTSYHDFDMCNAHPTILLWLCKQLNLNCERLDEYVSNRAEILEKSGKTKKDILTMMNCDKHKKSTNVWVQSFCNELVINKECITNIIANDYNSTHNSKHPLSSKMNKLWCDIENRCLHACMKAVDVDGENSILMFDGFMVQNEFTQEHINTMNQSTELIGIKWAEKEWEKGIIPESFKEQAERTYDIMKSRWEENHFIVEEPQLSYWQNNSDGARPINRQSCQDASRKLWFSNDQGKKTKLFDEWIDDEDALTYTKVEYVPYAKHDPPQLDEGVFNSAKPFAFEYIAKEERDSEAIEMFRTLLGELSEDNFGLEYMIRWVAHMLQFPTIRAQIMLLFKSHGGTGKDTLTNTITRMLGHWHCTVVDDMEKLFGQFNSMIANKLFITMNEIDGKQGVKYIEKLKNQLTAERIPITYKGKDSYEQDNLARPVAFSNNSNPIPVDSAVARRGLMNQVRADRQLPKSFFENYYTKLASEHWINSLASDLYDIDLTNFNILSPPETVSMRTKLQNKIQPLHKLLQELCEGKHADKVYRKVPKMEGCIAIEVAEFNFLYKQSLTEKYPSGWEPFMTDQKYINNVFGNYNDIVFPKVRKSVNKVQKQVHVIHTERMLSGLKNRCEYTMPMIDDDEDDEDDISE